MNANFRAPTGRRPCIRLVALAAFFWSGLAAAQVDCSTNIVGSLSADPASIALGGQSTLTWFIDGPNECLLKINGHLVSGNSLVVQPQARTIYVLTTVLLDGTDRELDRVTVTVSPDCATETTGFMTALPRTVHIGQRAALSWFVQRPAACQLPLRINGQAVASNGRIFVTPLDTTLYTLTTLTPDGAQPIATASVAVNRKTVRVSGNSQVWKDRLVDWLSEHGIRIILDSHVNMDLTDYASIYVGESVTLIGGRTARNLGPRIFTRSRPKPLFHIECTYDFTLSGDNARFTGFRLHGPHFNTMEGNANLEKGIQVTSCLNVKIDNMEVAGWSGQAIYVGEAPNNMRMFNPDAVHIHDNYIHHNQHKGGNGYGLDVSAGAYAKIYRNTFDFNRHAIAASGKPGVGYHAEDNLVLKGGGVHGTFVNSFTHQFDIHGDANCPPVFSSIWNCGNAGDQFWYLDNAFQYTRDNAMKIRGVPRVAAYIEGNVFAHDDLDDAVALRSRMRVHLGSGARRNITDIDTYGQYGVCDFDGDGKDDLFLATGKTWWYASSARMHWVFLKKANERLHQIGLGHFDNNRHCDVLAASSGNRWAISPGGSGAWTLLPGSYSVPFDQLRFADFNGDDRTDVFRRATNGQWSVVSPGVHGWRNLASSSFPLSALRFGDFTGDRKTDVLSRNGGRWSISRSATGSWERLNQSLNTDLASVLIADVDGNGIDDVVRFRVQSVTKGTWEMSRGGRGGWTALKTVQIAAPPPPPQRPLVGQRIYVGQFDGARGEDLLHVDYIRQSRLYSHPGKTLTRHNLFEY